MIRAPGPTFLALGLCLEVVDLGWAPFALLAATAPLDTQIQGIYGRKE